MLQEVICHQTRPKLYKVYSVTVFNPYTGELHVKNKIVTGKSKEAVEREAIRKLPEDVNLEDIEVFVIAPLG